MLYQPWVFSRISPFTKAVLTGSTASSSSSLRPNVTPQAAILATKGSKKGRRYKMIQGLDMMKIGDIWNNHLWYEWVYNCIYILTYHVVNIEDWKPKVPKISKDNQRFWQSLGYHILTHTQMDTALAVRRRFRVLLSIQGPYTWWAWNLKNIINMFTQGGRRSHSQHAVTQTTGIEETRLALESSREEKNRVISWLK